MKLVGYMEKERMGREEGAHAPVPKISETEDDEEYCEDDGTRVVPLCEVPYSKAKTVQNSEDEGYV